MGFRRRIEHLTNTIAEWKPWDRENRSRFQVRMRRQQGWSLLPPEILLMVLDILQDSDNDWTAAYCLGRAGCQVLRTRNQDRIIQIVEREEIGPYWEPRSIREINIAERTVMGIPDARYFIGPPLSQLVLRDLNARSRKKSRLTDASEKQYEYWRFTLYTRSNNHWDSTYTVLKRHPKTCIYRHLTILEMDGPRDKLDGEFIHRITQDGIGFLENYDYQPQPRYLRALRASKQYFTSCSR
ncbi:hypothetical protein EG329_011171 [Mollisiaceae sp. DMI_Dod_QoI]|nr:hypothetical protein EG329_011171 [Helotiales sp. DMI_Dod_QoI]